MSAQEGLWSREEVRVQAAQVSGQLDVWDVLKEVQAPRAQWFDVDGSCQTCEHIACRDCAADGAHHCLCEYDRSGRRIS